MKYSGQALQKQIAELLNALHKSGRPRVWSIIITLFGDAIVPRGGTIGLASIQEIFSHMRFEESAVRTAMSRLTQEGWLERTKHGRQSFYTLAPDGMGQFETATKRIYSNTLKAWSGTFDLVITKSEDAKARAARKSEMASLGFGSPSADVFIRPSTNKAPMPKEGVIASFTGESNADELLQTLVGESWPMDELQAGYEAIFDKYNPILNILKGDDELAALDALVMRILLIHDWRRVVLKDVDLPQGLKPDNWAGEKTRLLVGELYKHLISNSETYLDGCLADMNSMLPEPQENFLLRFTDL